MNEVLSFVAGGTSGKLSNETTLHSHSLLDSAPYAKIPESHKLQINTGPTRTDLNERAMLHPLCTQNTTAYVGQTAKMYCCLARLDRDLSVSTTTYNLHVLTSYIYQLDVVLKKIFLMRLPFMKNGLILICGIQKSNVHFWARC